jgi:hypothetical protein
MFGYALLSAFHVGAGMSAAVASVTSAIAYAESLVDSSIMVRQNGHSLILDGRAQGHDAKECALRLARNIACCPVIDEMVLCLD